MCYLTFQNFFFFLLLRSNKCHFFTILHGQPVTSLLVQKQWQVGTLPISVFGVLCIPQFWTAASCRNGTSRPGRVHFSVKASVTTWHLEPFLTKELGCLELYLFYKWQNSFVGLSVMILQPFVKASICGNLVYLHKESSHGFIFSLCCFICSYFSHLCFYFYYFLLSAGFGFSFFPLLREFLSCILKLFICALSVCFFFNVVTQGCKLPSQDSFQHVLKVSLHCIFMLIQF